MAARKKTLSVAHTKAIGSLVVSMTRLESVVIDLLAIFMEIEILTAVLAFSHQKASSNIDTLKALYSLGMSKEERESDPTLKLLGRVAGLADYRNSIVHAYWHVESTGVTYAVRFSARGHFSRTKKPIAASEILAKTREAEQVGRTLRDLRDHLR